MATFARPPSMGALDASGLVEDVLPDDYMAVELRRSQLAFLFNGARLPKLEQAYQERNALRYLKFVRVTTWAFLIANVVFVLYDLVRFGDKPDLLPWVLLARGAVILPSSAALLLYTYRESYKKRPQRLVVPSFLVGVGLVVYSIAGRDPGYGTMAVLIVYMYSFTPIDFFKVTAATLMLIVAFGGSITAIEQTVGMQLAKGTSLFDLMGVLLLFWGAVGIVGHTLEYSLRRSFLDEMVLMRQRDMLRREEELVSKLLANMLPASVSQQLKEGRHLIADEYSVVTVLFCEIYHFDEMTARIKPSTVVKILNIIYSEFDELISQHNVYKVETVGEVYMVVGGCPEPAKTHAVDAARMAIAMQDAMPTIRTKIKAELGQLGGSDAANFKVDDLRIRVGLNSGPIVAGIVGMKNPRYKLFGDTVNTASRMESTCLPGKIQASGTAYAHLRGAFELEARGGVKVKGKGVMDTWYVGRELATHTELPATPRMIKAIVAAFQRQHTKARLEGGALPEPTVKRSAEIPGHGGDERKEGGGGGKKGPKSGKSGKALWAGVQASMAARKLLAPTSFKDELSTIFGMHSTAGSTSAGGGSPRTSAAGESKSTPDAAGAAGAAEDTPAKRGSLRASEATSAKGRADAAAATAASASEAPAGSEAKVVPMSSPSGGAGEGGATPTGDTVVTISTPGGQHAKGRRTSVSNVGDDVQLEDIAEKALADILQSGAVGGTPRVEFSPSPGGSGGVDGGSGGLKGGPAIKKGKSARRRSLVDTLGDSSLSGSNGPGTPGGEAPPAGAGPQMPKGTAGSDYEAIMNTWTAVAGETTSESFRIKPSASARDVRGGKGGKGGKPASGSRLAVIASGDAVQSLTPSGAAKLTPTLTQFEMDGGAHRVVAHASEGREIAVSGDALRAVSAHQLAATPGSAGASRARRSCIPKWLTSFVPEEGLRVTLWYTRSDEDRLGQLEPHFQLEAEPGWRKFAQLSVGLCVLAVCAFIPVDVFKYGGDPGKAETWFNLTIARYAVMTPVLLLWLALSYMPWYAYKTPAIVALDVSRAEAAKSAARARGSPSPTESAPGEDALGKTPVSQEEVRRQGAVVRACNCGVLFLTGLGIVALSVLGREPGYGVLALYIVYCLNVSYLPFFDRAVSLGLLIPCYLLATNIWNRDWLDLPGTAEHASYLLVFYLGQGVPVMAREYYLRDNFHRKCKMIVQSKLLDSEQDRSNRLLESMLPAKIARQLKAGEQNIAGHFEEAAILFTDMRGFTAFSATITPTELVGFLNNMYSKFDRIADEYGIYKVEIIGDAYFGVAGCPEPMEDHVERCANAAFKMLELMAELREIAQSDINMRVGIHCGPLVAGVVGHKDPRYHLFGETVSLAMAMESNGIPGKVHISEAAYARLSKRMDARASEFVRLGGPTDLLEGVGGGFFRFEPREPMEIFGDKKQTYLLDEGVPPPVGSGPVSKKSSHRSMGSGGGGSGRAAGAGAASATSPPRSPAEDGGPGISSQAARSTKSAASEPGSLPGSVDV